MQVVDGERDGAVCDLVVGRDRAERGLVAGEDRVLRRGRAVRDVVGNGRLRQRGLVLGHLCLVGRDVRLGRGDVRVDLREVVDGGVVLLAQRRHLVLRLRQLRLDGGRLRLGVGDGVTGRGARKTKHSARQHCDDGHCGDPYPLEQRTARKRPRWRGGGNPLYVSHDGTHSYQAAMAASNIPPYQTPVQGRTSGMNSLVKPELRNSKVLSISEVGTERDLTNYRRPPWER